MDRRRNKFAIYSPNRTLPNESYLRDWVLLVETQLQLEQWMALPEMDVYTVEQAKTKFRELIGMIKQVGKRDKGMGCKTMNVHATKHVPQDIHNFGPPRCTNTKSNKTHHKRDKKV